MKRTEDQKRLLKIAVLLAIAAAEASAQDDKAARRIYDVTVGKPSTFSPRGEFKIVARVPNPS